MKLKLTWREFKYLAVKRLSEQMDADMRVPSDEQFVERLPEGEVPIPILPTFVYVDLDPDKEDT